MSAAPSSSLAAAAVLPSSGPVAKLLTDRLVAALVPTFLSLENESHKHNVPSNSETHFKLTIVSAAFGGLKLIDRHRLVNDTVKDPGAAALPVHALSIAAKTPEQWAAGGGAVHSTPPCLGGGGGSGGGH